MLDPATWTPAREPADGRPVLAVVVDTEEEFDWSKPHDRGATGVSNLRHQERAHRVFDRHGLRPTYVIDYPVASREEGWRPLKELLDAGRCEVGAHLHPWVNPPFEEEVSYRNSYPGNLPEALERAKLARLVEAIGANLGVRPTSYRAGRYGVGPNTARLLAEAGFTVDSSVVPWTDLSGDEGPDFSLCGNRPYWFAASRPLLEVPLTLGFVGVLGRAGQGLYRRVAGRTAHALHLPGVLARTGLLERIRLTPEGVDSDEHRRLTTTLLDQGHRVFVFSYHSPSLAPGNTPYVRSERDLDVFLGRLDAYVAWFLGPLGGRSATLSELPALLPPQ
jgi:peptidoglycan/xylan/chitin deacetylase (PgdA/CDA1 family)